MSYDDYYDARDAYDGQRPRSGGNQQAKKRDYAEDLSGYNDVAARLRDAKVAYPDCRLQPADKAKPYTIERLTVPDVDEEGMLTGTSSDRIFIVYVAAFYRDQWDQLPGIGIAWEPFPGRTPYTRNSEMQNAETSAWGRAMVAAFAADTAKGVASVEEITNRRAEDDEGTSRHPVARQHPIASREQIDAFSEVVRKLPQDMRDALKERMAERGIPEKPAGRRLADHIDLMLAWANELYAAYNQQVARATAEVAAERNAAVQAAPSIDALRDQIARVGPDGTSHEPGLGSPAQLDDAVPAPAGDEFEPGDSEPGAGPIDPDPVDEPGPDPAAPEPGKEGRWRCDTCSADAKGRVGDDCPRQTCQGHLSDEEPF